VAKPDSKQQLTVKEIEALVKQGFLLSPESGQVLLDKLDSMKAYSDAEADQFNDGVDAAERGESDDYEPSYEPNTDQWRVGWAWGKYNMALREKRRNNDGNLYHPTNERWIRA
jgi:hypothetical protein